MLNSGITIALARSFAASAEERRELEIGLKLFHFLRTRGSDLSDAAAAALQSIQLTPIVREGAEHRMGAEFRPFSALHCSHNNRFSHPLFFSMEHILLYTRRRLGAILLLSLKFVLFRIKYHLALQMNIQGKCL